MTTFTSDTTGINTGSASFNNSLLNIAATFTDNDLINQDEVEISWPSSDTRLNHCTVKFPNEAENFKEDSASWPPKISGSFYRGIGGKLYKPQSGWEDDGSSAKRLLNNLAVWSGSDNPNVGDGAAPEMKWVFFASSTDSCTLEIVADDSASISIRDITNLPSSSFGVVFLNINYPNFNTTTLNLVLNRKYEITINSSDTGGIQGVAGRVYGTSSGIEYWSTRAIAYDDMILQTQSNSIYQTFLQQDNNVELEDDFTLTGVNDYYHALAKAEERVRTSRSAVSVKFKYIIKNNFVEPGDYIRIDSARLSLSNLYLRVDEIAIETGGICAVTGSRFDWTQLAWNVKDDQLIIPESLYNLQIDAPSNASLISADTTLEGTIGKLVWDGVSSEVTGYIIYIAEVVNNQVGEYQEIGRTNNTYFSVPPFNYTTVAFGVRSYTTLGKKSPIVTTGIIQVTQNYRRDLTISANHLMFIQEAYSTNFRTPPVILTAVARGFSNPTYTWFEGASLETLTTIAGAGAKTLQIQPFLGAAKYYRVQVGEFKPGNNVAVESLTYTVQVQSTKEATRSTINANPSSPPPPPLNFKIKSLYNSIRLSWTIPSYSAGEVPHGYTEITAVTLENSFENWDAILAGITQAANNQEPGNTIFKELFNGRPLGDINNTGAVTSADTALLNDFLNGIATEAVENYVNLVFIPQLQTGLTGKYSAYFNYNTTELISSLEPLSFKVADVEGDINNYIFAGDPNTNYLFILREVNKEGVKSNESVVLSAKTSPNTTKLIETLSNKINATELNTTLNTRIDLIDAPTTGLVTKVTNLESTTSSFNTSITTLSSRFPSVGEGFNAKLTFNFDSSTEGFTATSASVSNTTYNDTGVLYLTNNNVSTDTVVISKTLISNDRFAGSAYTTIRARLRRVKGDSALNWVGTLRYSTSVSTAVPPQATHGFSSSFQKTVSLPSGVTLLTAGLNQTDWFIVEWDMANPADLNGGSDWVNSIISGIQLRIHNSQSSEWAIDWIAIGIKSVNIYQALYNQEVITRANADGALTQQITTVSANVNDLTATVQQKMTARSENGNLLAAYSLVIDNNGILSGFGLESVVNTQTGASQSIFGVNADKFYIGSPGVASVKPFIVTDNIVYIDTARIKDGSIANAKIGNLDADKITSGFISVDRIQGNSITAAKINSNGLSIRDSNGNILFNAGAAKPLDSTLVNGLGSLATKSSVTTAEVTGLGTLATKSSVTTAEVTGLGTLATKSSLDYTEVTGTKPPADADKTSANIAAGIANQGTLATKNTVGSSNLLFNGGFEIDDNFNGVPDGWTSTSIGSGLIYTRTLIDSTLSAGKAAKFEITGFNNPTSFTHAYVHSTENQTVVNPSQNYLLTISTLTSTISYQFYLAIFYYKADNTASTIKSSEAWVASLPLINQWYRITQPISTPADAKYIRIRFGLRRPSLADTTTGFVLFDELQFEEGDVATSFKPSLLDLEYARSIANTANSTAITANTNANNAVTAATNATAALANKLNNNARNLLAGPGGFATGNLDWDTNGTRTSGTGIGFTTKGIVAYNADGNPTFTLDGTTGNAAFKGDITGASGTFSGNLSGANITGATGTFSGILSADSIQANTITTQKIVGGAVTKVESFSDFTTFLFNSTEGWKDLATITLEDPDPTGQFTFVTIMYSIRFQRPGFGSYDFAGGWIRVLRDGVELFPYYGFTGDTTLTEVFKYTGGGTAIFKLQVQMPNLLPPNVLKGSVVRRSFVLLGTRR